MLVIGLTFASLLVGLQFEVFATRALPVTPGRADTQMFTCHRLALGYRPHTSKAASEKCDKNYLRHGNGYEVAVDIAKIYRQNIARMFMFNVSASTR